MSVSALGGGGASASMDPALAAGQVFHSGWLSKRTDWKDGKPVKHLKYDKRYCTLTAKALLVSVCLSRDARFLFHAPRPVLTPLTSRRRAVLQRRDGHR